MSRCHLLALAMLPGTLLITPHALALTGSIADGSWNDPAIWDSGVPNQSENGGAGERVDVNHDVTAPSGANHVATNDWFYLNDSVGATLTVQGGARVGSRYWTNLNSGGDENDSASITVEDGGEFVSAGFNNSNGTFVANILPGGLWTFDTSLYLGSFRGNVSANGTTATSDFNIEGVMDFFHVNNAGAGNGNTYTLMNGGVINDYARPGAAVGINSSPFTNSGGVPWDDLVVVGTGNRVVNRFGGGFDSKVTSIPAGLTVDISDHTVFDTDFSTEWSDWVTNNGGDPATVPGPRFLQIDDNDFFSGSGTIQFDVLGFDIDDNGSSPNVSDDSAVVFSDKATGGPIAAAGVVFSGTLDVGYEGPALSDDDLASLNGAPSASQPILLFDGATNGTDYSPLIGMALPDQTWNDGDRDFMVEFNDTFTLGATGNEVIYTSIASIVAISQGLPGDFNDDGVVDAADYSLWRDNLGALDETSLNGNGDGAGGVDADDYALWRENYGSSSSLVSSSATATPEPSLLVSLGLASLFGSRFRSRR